MSDLHDDLRATFEEAGHDVAEVSTNRDRIRVVLREEGADAEALRALVTDAVGAARVLGLNVTTESVGGRDELGTVVTFRHRD